MARHRSGVLKATLSVFFTGALLVAGFGGPAWAGPKSEPSGKPAAKPAKPAAKPAKPAAKPVKAGKPAPAVTEDTDDDGVPNNIADAGDNRHPSGKDRSVERGGSGNQGKARSDPDGTSNGGRDQPGGSGGVDRLDQDGNNGCGNDDDFEDDNRGRCGRAKTKTGPGSKGKPADVPRGKDKAADVAVSTGPGTPGTGLLPVLGPPTGTSPPPAVLGISVEQPAQAAPAAGPAASSDPVVLGTELGRADPLAAAFEGDGRSGTGLQGGSGPGFLPRTGWDALRLLILAALLLGAGGTALVLAWNGPERAAA